MKVLIVGGNIKSSEPSSVINKLYSELKKVSDSIGIFNGFLPDTIFDTDLILWTPEINNENEKGYPIKDIGSVLICSKVMREGYTHIDSVSRIFKMHGNAVIEIYKNGNRYEFELRDALNHCWCKQTDSIPLLCKSIIKFYDWSKESIRRSLKQKDNLKNIDKVIDMDLYYKFIQLNKRIADKVAVDCGNRFFGNYSTRCTKLFPSFKHNNSLFLFSPRNTNKKYITIADKVLCDYNNYYGTIKPSVDTPVQLEIYHRIPEINYMIHGHAYIKNEATTKNYFPCGDMREVEEVLLFLRQGFKTINLKNHGFLLIAETLEQMEQIYKYCDFKSL